MDNQSDNEEVLNAGKALLFLFIFIFGGFIISQIAAGAALAPFFDLNDIDSIQTKLSNPTQYPEMRLPLLISQGVSAIFLFILTPLAYIKYFKIDRAELLGLNLKSNIKILALSTIVILTAFPFVSLIYEWNMTWNIPGEFGAWATAQEEQLKVITEFLLKMETFGDFLLTFFVIAVIAGIGEELLFRGLIQTHLGFAIKNPHLIIWITSIFFGVFHLQFYGVVPRILLGAIMGYLFYWSGSIKYSMLAHVTNNGFQVIISYIMLQSGEQVNVVDDVNFPIYISVGSLIFTTILLYLFKNSFKNNELENSI